MPKPLGHCSTAFLLSISADSRLQVTLVLVVSHEIVLTSILGGHRVGTRAVIAEARPILGLRCLGLLIELNIVGN